MACLPTTLFRLICTGTIGILSLSTALAAEHDPVEQLDPIVITATASPTTLSQAPAAVTIISREQIAQQHANRLSTVLQQIPGVFVDEMGGRGGISAKLNFCYFLTG